MTLILNYQKLKLKSKVHVIKSEAFFLLMSTLGEPSYFVHAPLGHSIAYKSIDTSCKIESYLFVVRSNYEKTKISNSKQSFNPL